MSKKTCVLVTGVGGRSVGHQILHALLCLGDKYRIVATDAEAYSFGLFQVEHRYVVPLASDPRYVDALAEIIRKENVDVLLPGTPQEVRVAVESRSALPCELIASPADVVRLCDEKDRLSAWLTQNGFDAPRTVPASGWKELVSRCGFPIVGKPIRNSGGSRAVEILKDEPEVLNYLAERERNQDPAIFQEYVESHESEYTVGVLISRAGKLIDSIVMHRNLMGLSLQSKRVINGKTYALSSGYSQGFIVKHPVVQTVCEDLCLKIGARGPMNIQCRLVDGRKLSVFEVHPRFSGTTSARADVGFNEPDVLIRNALHGEEFGRLDYRTNVAAIRALNYIIVPSSDIDEVPRS